MVKTAVKLRGSVALRVHVKLLGPAVVQPLAVGPVTLYATAEVAKMERMAVRATRMTNEDLGGEGGE